MTKTKNDAVAKKLWWKTIRNFITPLKQSVFTVLLLGGGLLLQNSVLATNKVPAPEAPRGGRVENRTTPESCFSFNNGVITDYQQLSRECGNKVVIPSTINGKTVTGIGQYAFYQKNIQSLTLPNTLVSIGDNAFSYNQIQNIIIPEWVQSIGIQAFRKNQLNKVSIGNTVTTIWNYAFANNELREIYLPDSILSVWDRAFSYNKLAIVKLWNKIDTIGIEAFSENQITNLVIPNSVKIIKAGAFSQNKLNSLDIGNGLTRIERSVFSTNQLTRVRIPDSVTFIEVWAFANNQLEDVHLWKALTTINLWAFENNQLTSLIIPASVKFIGYDAFMGNKENPVWGKRERGESEILIQKNSGIVLSHPDAKCFLFDPTNGSILKYRNEFSECWTRVNIPEYIANIPVSSIGDYAFSNKQIDYVNFPNTITTIGPNAFSWNNLTTVNIPNQITSIGASAFEKNKLSSIVIGNEVIDIGDRAFSMNKLTALKLPDSLQKIGKYAFSYNQLTWLNIPNSVKNIEKAAFSNNKDTPVIGWRNKGNREITVAYDSNINLRASIERCFDFNPENGEIIRYKRAGSSPECGNEIDIPRTIDNRQVKILGESSFQWKGLIKVTIPNSVVSIKKHAFDSNQLTSITIPDSVKEIWPGAFGINQLKTVHIWNWVQSIGEVAFYKNQISDLKIPNSVTNIGRRAFAENQLSRVQLPNALREIQANTFEFNQLTHITIPSSVREIHREAFINNQLSSVQLGTQLNSIGEKAFEKNKLKELHLPDSLLSIWGNAFLGNQLSKLHLGNQLDEIGFGAFAENQLTSVEIPNSVSVLSNGAFAVNQLQKVKLSENLTKIDPWTFAWNDLEEVLLPETIHLVNDYAFFANKKNTIFDQAANLLDFDQWYGNFPEGISNKEKVWIILISALGFDNWKYQDWWGLAYEKKSLKSPEKAKTGSFLKTLVQGIFGTYAQAWSEYYDIVSELSRLADEQQNPVILRSEQADQVTVSPLANAELRGKLKITPEHCFEFNKSNGTIIKYLKNKVPECGDKVIIPPTIDASTVKIIGERAFYKTGLSLVVFPDTLEEIGKEAFSYNQLREVSIPSSVKIVRNRSFVGNGMENLTLSEGLKTIEGTSFYNNRLSSLSIPSSVIFIGGGAFNNNQLPDDQAFVLARKSDGTEDISTLVSYGGAKREKVEIPNTIKTLGVYSFYSNNVSSVIIPEGVAVIKNSAFDNNKLTAILLPESTKTIESRAFFRNPNLSYAQALSPRLTVGECAFACKSHGWTVEKSDFTLWKTQGVEQLQLHSSNTHIKVNPLELVIHSLDEHNQIITGEQTWMGLNKKSFDAWTLATAQEWFEAGKSYTITPPSLTGYESPTPQQITFMMSPSHENHRMELTFIYPEADIADHFCDYKKTAKENPKISKEECKALLDIYSKTQGSGWKASFGWKVAALNKKDQFERKICKWKGISCSDGKLNSIDLSNNNLKGSLATSFKALRNLKSFKVGNNQLSKSLSKINNPNLEVLIMENNPLNEDFSSWSINSHSQLQELKLNSTQIVGILPDSLPLSLMTFELANNRLNGTLPSGIGNLDQLKTLDLSNNFFVENFSNKINRKFNQLENFKIDRNYIANLDTAGSYLGFLSQNPKIKTKNPENIKQYKISFQDKKGNQISMLNDLTLWGEREVFISRLLSLWGNTFSRESLSESELNFSFDSFQIQVDSSAFPLLKLKIIGETSTPLNAKLKGSSWGEWTNAKLSLIKNTEDPNNPDTPALWTWGIQTATGFLDNGLNFELGGKYLDQFFSFVHFNVAGNDFGGGFFWLPVEKLEKPITIKTRNKNGEDEVKVCHNKVRGFYYNSQRGERLRPLDDASRLALKKYSPTTYDNLNLKGGRYTSCIGSNGAGNNQEDAHGIYGSIEHTYQGNTLKLNAGIAYDTATNKMKTDGFRCNFMRLNNSYPFGYIYDDYGHIGFVGAMISSGAMNSSNVNNFHNGLNGLFDQGLCINQIFGYNGVEISYTADPNHQIPGINSWNDLVSLLIINPWSTKETLFNLGIKGIVGLTSDLTSESKKHIESNTFDSTLLLKTDESIAKALNLVNKNAEKLCRGKWRSSQMSITTDSDIICVKGENESSSISFKAEDLAGKTLIAKETNVKLISLQENNSSPINLFIDKGNLILPSSVHTWNLSKFDSFGYSVNAPGTGYAMANYLKGNFIINGLLMGHDLNNQASTIKNKLYIHGKILSFNTFGKVSQQRLNALQKLLGDQLKGADKKFIPINELFTWSCILGIGSDGTWCKGISQQEAWNQSQSLLVDKAFGLIDMSFPTKLLD